MALAATSAATPAVDEVGDVPGPESDTSCAPRRGRPRSVEVDEKLLEATLALAGEVGIGGMSMDDVAQRAGASKATIYRRWPSKEALVLDAMRHAMRPFDQVDTGTLRGDLVEYLHELADRLSNGKTSDVLPHLLEVSVRDEALRASLDDYVRYRRQPLSAIVCRGVERHELPTDTDVDTLVDVLIGPFMYRRLFSRQPLDADFIEHLLAVVLPRL